MVNIAKSLFILGLNFVLTYARVCNAPGSCINTPLLDATVAVSKQDCKDHCQSSPDCFWYVYDLEEGSLCLTFEDCPEISTEGCPNCLTNEQPCIDCNIQGLCQVLHLY